MTLIADHLTYGYRKGTPVIRDLSVEISAGAITAIVGPNGAGKSTLLRLLAGVRQPWSGTVSLNGETLERLPATRRAASVALVAQRPTIAGAYTVRQVVQFGRYAQGQHQRAIDASLSALELDSLASTPVHELSIGQQQRVAIARAFAQLGFQKNSSADGAMRGKAFVADEPIAAMDPRYAALTMRLLRSLARQGAVVAVALHDLSTALNSADQCVLLDSRGIAAAGPTADTLNPDQLEMVFGARFQRLGDPGQGAITVVDQAP